MRDAINQRNILDFLENSAEKYPDKRAYFDRNSSLTYSQVQKRAKAIGTFLISSLGRRNAPILVFMDKRPDTLCAFWGCVYAGCFYVPTDTTMPEFRRELILNNLNPIAIITDKEHFDSVCSLNENTYIYEEIIDTPVDEVSIGRSLHMALDTDPVYALYTSGSTGVPKGVVVCHASLIDYIDSFGNEIPLNHDDIMASQAPFYFDASLIDIYCTLRNGATLGIVPIEYFSIPIKLLEYLRDEKITAIRWVPSAMKMISMFEGFSSVTPDTISLKTVIFGAEIMPTKCYNYWKSNLTNTTFVQNYGPTEITGVCTYYIIDREFSNDERIPIGKPFYNSGVMLLDEDNNLITDSGITGEICVRGTCLSLGYYNAPEITSERFVQNPLNPFYPEKIYKTGDLGFYNSLGELVFVSRKDYQIKHMGHRIELGEIEYAISSLPGIRNVCCLHDEKRDKIVMFYEADSSDEMTIREDIKNRLAAYMVPNVYKKMEKLPLLVNGKTDRVTLKSLINKK